MKRLDITASDGGEQGSIPFGSIKNFAIEIDGDGEADESDSGHDDGGAGGAEQQEDVQEAEEEQTFEEKYSTILCVIYGGFTPISLPWQEHQERQRFRRGPLEQDVDPP